jgi:hypothetical protein
MSQTLINRDASYVTDFIPDATDCCRAGMTGWFVRLELRKSLGDGVPVDDVPPSGDVIDATVLVM